MLGDVKIFGIEGLGALGKCDWNNPCNEWDKVGYRLEYYNLVFFEHGGNYRNDHITLQDFLIIIYQTWLQLIMFRQRQDLSGPIFQEFGIFGNKYFIAFGGSADSRAKEGDNSYFADCRWNCECNKKTPPFSRGIWDNFGYGNADDFFVKKKYGIEQFLDNAFNLEAEEYALHKTCKDGMTIQWWDYLLTMWIDPIGTLNRGYSDLKAQEEEYRRLRESLLIRDVGKNVIDPLRQSQQHNYQNQAIAIVGVGLLAIAGLAYTFKKMN